MGFLRNLLKKGGQPKPARISGQSSRSPAPPQSPAGGLRAEMLGREKAAMAVADFDEAAGLLTELYKSWLKSGKWDAVGGYNYVSGKQDAFSSISRYLSGDKDYDSNRLHSLIEYHAGFPGDVFHQGAREVLEWAWGRTLTDLKSRHTMGAADKEAGGEEMFAAVYRRDADEVRKLLERGAKANVQDGEGWTPLHYFASEGRTELVALLLAAGADTEVRNNRGATALRGAAYYGHTETAALLLDKGADIEARDGEDRTPLHRAAERGKTETAALLIDRGANVNAKTRDGKTPLSEAAWFGTTEVAALLIDRGAEVNVRDKYGKSPLGRALEFNHPETAALLREHGSLQ